MECVPDIDKSTQQIIIHLIDSWNVGIKKGFIKNGCKEEVVKKYMKKVGIIVYLRYICLPEKSRTEFIMVKASESDNLPYPFEGV